MFNTPLYAWSRVVPILLLWNQVQCDFEVCNPGVSTTVYKFMQRNCPFGVLFNHPVISNCLSSTNEPEHFVADLCDESGFEINENDKPYKIQLAFSMNDEAVDIANSCASDGEPTEKCTGATLIEATELILTEPPRDEDDEDPDLTPEEIARQNDPLVKDQTERLFKFMFGLSDNADDEGPNMRLVKILEQSFKIVGKFCETKYVSLDFGEDILRAFLFLVREADISRIIDVPVSEYEEIKEVLDMCENMSPPPFEFKGRSCKTYSHVHAFEKSGQSMRFVRDEFSFQWGKHDIPVDATWGVLSFVHGLCYGTFKIHLNLHHLFQRVVEKLFTPEIVNRW
ncbi:hypothetical protein Ocin01_13418 [Orchesella cincta]|uniref:Uncharacterized protein n=1 Tax=Orchesella cincta TaxID=48709 RepID=A0A1D2MKB7_ORCCI|nr:hypothetical protein Ocin01_13418 [Orchesella cincta]